MLALTRGIGESIMIGEAIEIVVASVKGENIRIGIIAPKDVIIKRKEFLDKGCVCKKTKDDNFI